VTADLKSCTTLHLGTAGWLACTWNIDCWPACYPTSDAAIRDVMEPAKIRFSRIRISHLTSAWIQMRIYHTNYLQCYQTRA